MILNGDCAAKLVSKVLWLWCRGSAGRVRRPVRVLKVQKVASSLGVIGRKAALSRCFDPESAFIRWPGVLRIEIRGDRWRGVAKSALLDAKKNWKLNFPKKQMAIFTNTIISFPPRNDTETTTSGRYASENFFFSSANIRKKYTQSWKHKSSLIATQRHVRTRANTKSCPRA